MKTNHYYSNANSTLIRRWHFLILLILGCIFTIFSTALADSWLWPVPEVTRISAYFGENTGFEEHHSGIDITNGQSSYGTPIVAAKDGVVRRAFYAWGEDIYEYGSYVYGQSGYTVVICHASKLSDCVEEGNVNYTHYAHMSSIAGNISQGSFVKAGDIIGYMGGTGQGAGESASGADDGRVHLHFSLKNCSYGGQKGLKNNNPDAVTYTYNYPSFSYNHLPIGAVDYAGGTNDGKIHISGWVFDPDDTSVNNLLLQIYVGQNGGVSPINVRCNGTSRPDVEDAYGSVGKYHGFSLDVEVNETGTFPIYVYAVGIQNSSKIADYKLLKVGPEGAQSGTVTVQKNLGKLDVNGYLNGKERGTLENFGTFDLYLNGTLVLNDVNDSFGETEIGTHYEIKDIKTINGSVYNGVHSGSLSGTVTAGRKNVYLSFTNPNIYVNDLPKGSLQYLGGNTDGTISVKGWAYDPDQPSEPLEIYIHVAGHQYKRLANGILNTEIAQREGCGYYQGFDILLPVEETGWQTVSVYAIDARGGSYGYTCIYDGAVNGQIHIDNSTRVNATGVTLSQSSATLVVGDTTYLSATVTPDNATIKTVDWSSSDSTIATVSDGVVTGKKTGTAVITAASTGNPSVKAQCQVTVINSGSSNNKPLGSVDSIYGTNDGKIHLSGWTFDPDDPSDNDLLLQIYVGQNGGIDPYNTHCNGVSRPDVEDYYPYVGTNHGFDLYVSINETGTFPVYVYAVGPQNSVETQDFTLLKTETITVSNTENNLPRGSLTNLNGNTDGTISFKGWAYDPDLPTESLELHIYVGAHQYKRMANGKQNLEVAQSSGCGEYQGFEFQLPVEETGWQTVSVYAIDVNGESYGYTCIYDGEANGQIEISNTSRVDVAGVSVNQTSAILFAGESVLLSAAVIPDNATIQTVEWRSSDPNVVAVSNGRVTAKNAGTALITAVSTVNPSAKAQCQLTVIADPENTLTLPADLTEIKASAFEGAAAIEEVILPEKLTMIGARAFAGCSNLKRLRIPDSVTSIAADAFSYTSAMIFSCTSDNDGADFARRNNIAYRIEP